MCLRFHVCGRRNCNVVCWTVISTLVFMVRVGVRHKIELKRVGWDWLTRDLLRRFSLYRVYHGVMESGDFADRVRGLGLVCCILQYKD